MSLDGGGGQRKWTRKKKILLWETPFYLIACAPCKLLTTKHHLLLTSYELPSSPLKPQAPSTSLSSGRFLRPQLPYLLLVSYLWGLLYRGGSVVKQSACQCRRLRRRWFDPWVGKIPWRRKWLMHTSILAWKISMDRGAWRAKGHGTSKESETNEHTHRDRIKFIFLLLICLAYVWAKLLQSCLTLCNLVDYSPQAPLSMGFSRQGYWSGLPCHPPGDLPVPGIETVSLISPALAGRFFTTSATWEALLICLMLI